MEPFFVTTVFSVHTSSGVFMMMKTKIAIAILVAAGLAGSTFTAEAKSQKHSKHHSSMTTGANMKSTKSGGTMAPSSQGNAGSGTAEKNSGAATSGK